MVLKERYDSSCQIISPSNDVPVQRAAVIVRAVIHHHLTHSEKLSELVQGIDTSMSLRHHELVKYLVAGSVADSVHPFVLSDETD